jgi:MFS family permease
MDARRKYWLLGGPHSAIRRRARTSDQRSGAVMTSSAKVDRRSISLVCLAVFGLMTAQQLVYPILAPLARELGFSEVMLGIVLAVGATGVVIASPFWGRRVTTWGHRRVLLISLGGGTAGLLAFAIIAQVGLTGALAVPLLFALVLLTRSVVFGIAWGAAPVTAQAYVTSVTASESERVRGMSMIGAAQGLGMAAGPALGSLLIFGGLLVPIYVAPVILAAIAVVLWRALPKPSAPRTPRATSRVSPFDRRMWPFLTAGFGMYLTFGIAVITVGFLVQDRLQLSAEVTGQATGVVMLTAAVAVILVQTVLVPQLAWAPVRLIRAGTIVMTAGMILLAVAPNGPLIAAGMGLLGAGIGFGLPGYMSAPTLLATKEEQGVVAGLVGSTNSLTFMLSPLLGTALYQVAPALPYLAATGLLVFLMLFVLIHPGVRQSRATAPTSPELAEHVDTGQ